MEIGIIVYSQTGNTDSVAQKLKERLAAAGHAAEIEKVTITGEAKPGAKNIQFDNYPQADRYDALVFASPVQGFSLAPAMAAYLDQLPPLRDKKTACFVTKQLPGNWTGGNRAIAQMKKICESKGAAVCGSAIVIWAKSRRDQAIEECVIRLSEFFN
jgi:NAD(P)H dehydrogenase (quinone)